MYKVQDKTVNNTLSSLLSSSVSGTVKKSDEAFAAIRSFQSSFKQISRTPEMIRIMLQTEFNFDGVIDVGGVTDADKQRFLKMDWFDCTFVVVDYSNVEPWLKKIHSEVEKGRTVVALVPSRTSTVWFHESVLEVADEVRFVKGRVILTGSDRPSAFPDAICVFKRFIKKRKRTKHSVAILKCRTSFTSDETRFDGDLDESNQ